MIDVSREDGAFGFENVVYGHWIVAEIEPPEGFILALEMHPMCMSIPTVKPLRSL